MSEMRAKIASLSPRQLEVMQGVARRLSSKEIGVRLALSPATVDSHIAAALQRLGLTSRRDAALHLIELGYASQISASEHPDGAHHGADVSPQLPPVAPGRISRILRWFSRRGRDSGPGKGAGHEPRSRPIKPGPIKPGMGRAVLRFLLDALYISLFFAVMSAVAFGAHWVVIQCEQQQIDPVVLFILKGVSYVLAGLDAIGVVTATGFLTYRFIRAIMTADE